MSDLPPDAAAEDIPSDADAFVGAFALLMRPDGPAQYLALRDGDGLDLIRAVRAEGTSYRESLLATIGERLGLDPARDVVASGVPRAHLNSRLCGKGSGQPKWYVCEFFVVRLFGKRWSATLESRDDIVWLTGDELMSGGRDGQPLAADVSELLGIADAIPPDER